MLYSEFKKWLESNCPLGVPEHDFLEFCAMIGCIALQKAIDAEEDTIEGIIERLFDKPVELQ